MTGDPIRACVLTVSDRCSRGEAEDTSGPALCAMLDQKLGAVIEEAECVPDERDRIAAVLREWSNQHSPDLILTTGGTGLAPRDVTPEATRGVIEREHAGLIQLMQLRCLQKTVLTYLSRGVAGTLGRTLIINLPGSKKGATECLEALLDLLPHAINVLRGEVGDGCAPK